MASALRSWRSVNSLVDPFGVSTTANMRLLSSCGRKSLSSPR